MASKIIKIIWNLFWIGLMLLVVGMLAFRFFTLNHYPSFAEGVLPTKQLTESLKANTLAGTTWKIPEELDEEGYFFVHQPIYFEKEKTFIITVRYNNSLLSELGFDGTGEELALFPSLSYKDAEKVFPSFYEYGYAFGLYSYRRYVFEGVELSEHEHLYLNIHLEEDYEAAPFVMLDIHDPSAPTEKYALTRKDEEALLS